MYGIRYFEPALHVAATGHGKVTLHKQDGGHLVCNDRNEAIELLRLLTKAVG